MTESTYKRAIGRFITRENAEAALMNLRDSGFNMDKVSVLSRGSHDSKIAGVDVEDADGNYAKEGAKSGAKTGAVAGGAIGLIGSIGILAIPGVGPIAEVGFLLGNALLGSGIGAAGGTLFGALVGWGIPEDKAKYYDERLNQGDYIILAEESDREIQRAGVALNQYDVHDWNVYNANPTSNSTSTVL